MILVTLGTQDKQFYRLLQEIDQLIKEKKITDKVIVQAGCSSDFKTDRMKLFNLISMEDFADLVKKCDLLITHGGVGSILNGIQNGKKIVAVPRLEKYKEHVNDHQIQIVNKFYNDGYILKVDDIKELNSVIKQAKQFKPKRYCNNNVEFVNKIQHEIDKYLRGDI